MAILDMLKTIDSLAKENLISKPYVVGGLPRDIYLNKKNIKTSDIDVTTNSPDVLRLGILLADLLNVTMDLSDDGHITVFADEYDIDFSSNFVSDKVLEVLSKEDKEFAEAFSRDFTINALHMDMETGEIVDPTHKGFDDIKNNIIDTPVDPDITLRDDPRRAYRAINLAARYGYDISKRVKEYVKDNPGVFSGQGIKDKYISLKITKALKENEELTIKLLKDMDLFKRVPLTGHFKEVLIRRKILSEYLGSSALDQKTASSPSTWREYELQGEPHKRLSKWWKKNYKDVGGRSPLYHDWQSWYMEKYRGEWGGQHKSPSEALSYMKSIEKPSFFESGLLNELKNRGKTIVDKVKAPALPALPEVFDKFKLEGYDGEVLLKNETVDIENITQPTKDFIRDLGRAAKALKAETPVITSGWRSLKEQADTVIKNWRENGGFRGGRDYLISIYGNDYGGRLSDAIEIDKSSSSVMKVIKSRGSYHMLSPGQAIDLRVTNGIKRVLDYLDSLKKYNLYIKDETNTAGPHYHVSVKGYK